MSTGTVVRSRFPRATANIGKYAGAAGRGLATTGELTWFVVQSLGQIPHAIHSYRKETLRLIAQIGMGTGAMAVIGGTAAIVGFVTLSGSSLVAIQGFASLGNIGVEAFTGFFAAMIKAATFGLIAGLVGCYRGLTVSGGSKGLGTAVNETVVLCVVALYAVNVILTTIGVRFGTGH